MKGLYKTVSVCDFHDSFEKMGRQNQFTYEGRIALFEYLENLADDSGEGIELDVIALCCEYTEYESLEAFRKEYGDEYQDMSDIENETTVIPVDDETFIIQQF